MNCTLHSLIFEINNNMRDNSMATLLNIILAKYKLTTYTIK